MSSRASYKVGLCDLTDEAIVRNADSSSHYDSGLAHMEEKRIPSQSPEDLSMGDTWGYYVDTASFR